MSLYSYSSFYYASYDMRQAYILNTTLETVRNLVVFIGFSRKNVEKVGLLREFLRGFLFGDYRYPKNYLPAGFARIAIMYLIVLGWASVASRI